MGTKAEFDEDELAGLSEAERAAMADDDAGDGDGDGNDDAGGDDGADAAGTDDAGDNDAGDAAGDDAGAADAGTGADEGADDTAGDQATVDADPKFVPQFAVAPPENYDARVSEINAKITGLREQMESGELTLSQYEEQKDALVEERSDLKSQKQMADFAEQQNAEQSNLLWEHEQKKFFRSEANQAYMKDSLLFATLNTAVKAIANNPKNAAMGPDEVLAEADKQVRARMVVGDKPTPKPKVQERQIDRTKLPPTLHGLPSAEIPETGESTEFAYLDKLTGMDLERALAKMTPEQEARYLQG